MIKGDDQKGTSPLSMPSTRRETTCTGNQVESKKIVTFEELYQDTKN